MRGKDWSQAPFGPFSEWPRTLKGSRQIVELHGGRIWVEEAPAQGARFVVELPLQPPG